MSVTYDLFLRWKALKKLRSERRALLALGMSSGAAVPWKNGRNGSAELIEKMAKDLGEDPAMWVAMAMHEQSQGETARTWGRIARKLGATLTMLISLGITNREIHLQINNLHVTNNIHYAKLFEEGFRKAC